MSEQMMNEILKRLDLIGEKLTQGGEFVLQAYVRQQFWVNGVLDLTVGVFLLISSLALLWTCMWCIRKGNEKQAVEKRKMDYDQTFVNGYHTLAFWTGVASMIALINAVIGAWDAAGHIINPTYYALMDLAKLVGK